MIYVSNERLMMECIIKKLFVILISYHKNTDFIGDVVQCDRWNNDDKLYDFM